MLSVTIMSIMLNVIMMSVFVLNVKVLILDYCSWLMGLFMELNALKNLNSCYNTKIYSYLVTSAD